MRRSQDRAPTTETATPASDLLIDRARPRLAVVSTDSDERPELPDRRVVGLLQIHPASAFSTWRSGGGVLVTLDGENIRAENVAIPPNGQVYAIKTP